MSRLSTGEKCFFFKLKNNRIMSDRMKSVVRVLNECNVPNQNAYILSPVDIQDMHLLSY